MRPVQPVGFPDRWDATPLWTLFQRASRRGYEDEDLLSVYRDHGVVARGFSADNWNRIPDDLSKYLLVERGDIVVNKMKAWQGSLGVSMLRGIVSPAYFAFSPARGSYNPRFLHYVLRSQPYVDSYGRMSDGIRVDQWDLDPWAFSRLLLPLPPLAEQHAIADFLDRETAAIDALIEKQRELVALLRERRASIIEKETQPGAEFDRVLKIGRAFSLLNGDRGANYPSRDEFVSEGVPFVNAGHLSGGDVDFSDMNYVTEEKFAAMGGAKLQPRDILFCLRGSLGKFGVIPKEIENGSVASSLVVLRVKDPSMDLRFVTYLLETRRMSDMISLERTGSAQPNLAAEQLSQFKFRVPGLEEQREIADYLDRETTRIDALIAKAEEFIALAQERRSAVITAAVTGRIDVGVEREAA